MKKNRSKNEYQSPFRPLEKESIRKHHAPVSSKATRIAGLRGEASDNLVTRYIYKKPMEDSKRGPIHSRDKLQREKNANQHRHLSWKNLPTVLKLESASKYLLSEKRKLNGEVWSISINISEVHSSRLRKKSYIHYLRDELLRSVKNLIPEPLYWLAVDINEKGRLHFHGVLYSNADIAYGVADRLRQRFCRGRWHSGAIKATHVVPHYESLDWACYCTRNARKTADALGHENLWFISRPLLERAKAFHEESLTERIKTSVS